jgi:phenylpropionate dioxygenase-like ring-hydroxylating dioxygenase large terminal subunit
MGLLTKLRKFNGGYPGGWQPTAPGAPGPEPRPFVQPTDRDDRRSLIPPLGLREYWYPALPARAVGWTKPVGLRMLGEDLVFFRDTAGEVQALLDVCPHRGVALSEGDCFWQGTVSCPYHGATYNGDGECVEFITEGPDSKMVGRLRARKFPTRTLKDMVFVWMGEGVSAPIEEDVPPEFFEGDDTVVLHAFNHWRCNWMVGLENTADAHGAFYVHRDSVNMLRSRTGGWPRSPIGYRAKIVNNRAAIAVYAGGANYYHQDGKMPYQLYYPRVKGYWPKHRWRLLWTRFTEKRLPEVAGGRVFDTPEEWGRGMHLPSIARIPSPDHMITRWCVPIDATLTRVVFFRADRCTSSLGKAYARVAYRWRSWLNHFNFNSQDYYAMATCRYDFPEYLSATDMHVIAERRLVTEHARGIHRPEQVTTVEKRTEEMAQEFELQGAGRRS